MTDDAAGDPLDEQPAVGAPDFAATLAQRALSRLKDDGHPPVEAALPLETAPPRETALPLEPPLVDPPPAETTPTLETPHPVEATLPVAAAPFPAPAKPATRPETTRLPEPVAGTVDVELRPPVEFAELDAENDDFSLRWLVEWVAVLVGAVIVALILRAVLFQVFYIPSPSMEPTLEKGDRVMVFKLDTAPERGEVMVFERPPSSAAGDINDLIKRTIGLPGETISARDGQMYIDGLLLVEPYTIGADQGNRKPVWRPECENERGDGNSCLIPEDYYFMMGDNRNHSSDSRVFGPISGDLFVGRAVLQIWPLGEFERL